MKGSDSKRPLFSLSFEQSTVSASLASRSLIPSSGVHYSAIHPTVTVDPPRGSSQFTLPIRGGHNRERQWVSDSVCVACVCVLYEETKFRFSRIQATFDRLPSYCSVIFSLLHPSHLLSLPYLVSRSCRQRRKIRINSPDATVLFFDITLFTRSFAVSRRTIISSTLVTSTRAHRTRSPCSPLFNPRASPLVAFCPWP
jgi:hypothetical protein